MNVPLQRQRDIEYNRGEENEELQLTAREQTTETINMSVGGRVERHRWEIRFVQCDDFVRAREGSRTGSMFSTASRSSLIGRDP